MRPVIGIDLGTTHSLVAVMHGGAPVLVPNAMGDHLTPSVVAVSSTDELVVGRPAQEIAAVRPDACCSLFKRDMGTDVEKPLGDNPMKPQMLSSLVLRALKQDAEEFLADTVEQAVITVPAYFNDAQRQATKDAAELAGLQVARILNEPTAAALAYGLHSDPRPRKLLVFDLGGGTFDVSIVDCEDGILEVLASAGEAFLGGEDFTRNLMGRLLARHEISLPEFEKRAPVLAAKLRYRVEAAKKQLSATDTTTVVVPDPNAQQWTPLTTERLSREDLAAANQELVDRFTPVTWRALRDAGLAPNEVTDVLLVGGASRMQVVKDFIRQMFDLEPIDEIDPDRVVAQGAAVQAALVMRDDAVSDIVATDVMPHTLGTSVIKTFGARQEDGFFLPIIERNTTIPVSKTTILSTVDHGQRGLRVDVFQGESRFVKDNLKLGELTAEVPAGPAGKESIEVRFTYDLNGILEVEVRVLSTDEVKKLVLHSRPGKLSEKETRKALHAMQALKVRARDQAENRFLLEKAQRVYSELLDFHRHRLSELLDAFESALEVRDKDLIESLRAELELFLSLHDETGDDADGHA